MGKYCDLHTHSKGSDGTDTPLELIRAAKAQGLSAVALTDHNTISALTEFMRAAENEGIEGIPGIEFSVDFEGKELHLLGLFINPEYFGEITAFLEDVRRAKEESNEELAKALCMAGYEIDYDEIKRSSDGYVNRAHFATALVKKGYAKDNDDAFDNFLCAEAGYYKAPPRLLALDIIKYLRSTGAVPVLAHPFLNFSEEKLRRFLPKAREAGLAGMETDYSTYDEETTALAHSIAAEYGILNSGGSDYHGERKPDISIGTGRGNLAIPYSYLEGLKALARTAAFDH